MYKKNESYLISKAFKNFLLASILTSVVTQINMMSDSIIVGNLISADAVSAINLTVPVVSLLTGFISLLGLGASVQAAKAFGEQRYQEASKIYTVSFVSLIVLLLVVAVLSLSFLPYLVNCLCDNGHIAIYLKDYIRILIPSFIVYAIFMNCGFFIGVDGNPKLITKAVIINSLVNILCDYVFIKFFQWGISGAAYATLAGNIVGIGVVCKYMMGNHFLFRFTNPHSDGLMKLKNNVKQGTPLLVGNWTFCFLFFSFNSIVLQTQGRIGIFVMSICFQILMIGMMAVNGLGATLISVGGVLLGEKDFTGFKILTQKSLQFLLVVVCMITAYVWIAPQTIIKLYGINDTEQMAVCTMPLKIFILCVLPFFLVMFVKFVHQLLGYVMTCLAFTVLPIVVVIPIVWFTAKTYPDGIWSAFPIAYFLVLIIQVLFTIFLRRKHLDSQFYTLIPSGLRKESLKISVLYNEKDVCEALEKIKGFLTSAKLDISDMNNIQLCCEELMYNIEEHATDDPEKRSFDVHIYLKGDEVTVTLKDDGIPFNPIFQYVKPTKEQLLKSEIKLGLTVVNGLCNDMNYKYMLGQNMVYLNFSLKH